MRSFDKKRLQAVELFSRRLIHVHSNLLPQSCIFTNKMKYTKNQLYWEYLTLSLQMEQLVSSEASKAEAHNLVEQLQKVVRVLEQKRQALQNSKSSTACGHRSQGMILLVENFDKDLSFSFPKIYELFTFLGTVIISSIQHAQSNHSSYTVMNTFCPVSTHLGLTSRRPL